MIKIAFFTGSFDPITNGHLDIITRASKIFDKVVVGVFDNLNKNYWWDNYTRTEMVKKSVNHIKNVEVKSFVNTLVIEGAKQVGATCIVKGLRNTMDYDYEKISQKFNLKEGNIETIYLFANEDSEIISSSFVKELAILDGPYEQYIPQCIVSEIKNKVREKHE